MPARNWPFSQRRCSVRRTKSKNSRLPNDFCARYSSWVLRIRRRMISVSLCHLFTAPSYICVPSIFHWSFLMRLCWTTTRRCFHYALGIEKNQLVEQSMFRVATRIKSFSQNKFQSTQHRHWHLHAIFTHFWSGSLATQIISVQILNDSQDDAVGIPFASDNWGNWNWLRPIQIR